MAKLSKPITSSPPSTFLPWVLIAGGFHHRGGQDKANAALAAYLIQCQTPLHLIAHAVDPEFSNHPGVKVHIAPRPAASFLLGEWPLERRGRAVARLITAKSPGARVLVNGGNCNWPDINWVHAVHHAWPCIDRGAPLWFRLKNRITKLWATRRERRAIRTARYILANSERTRRDLINYLKLEPKRIRTVYLGTDEDHRPPTAVERARARAWLGQADKHPLVVFVGALSHDHNKGLDVLWSAWQALCARSDWDANLIVAGSGNGIGKWQRQIVQAGLGDRVRLLGYTGRVAELLAAADLLVSPVRYEAYGLNVQEAICRGVPAMVSACAGVAERYPPTLVEMILPDPVDPADLAARLLRWRSNMNYWRDRFLPLSKALRRYTWADMARRIVSIVEEPPLQGVE